MPIGLGGKPGMSAIADSISAIAARYPQVTLAVSVRSPAGDFDLLGERSFHAASTVKVPVMIETFRQVEEGRLDWEQQVPVVNEFRSIVDGSSYAIGDDSDDALYGQLGQALSVRNLVERAITTSSNLATNLLVQLVSVDSAQATVDRMGASGMRVLRGVEDLKAFEAGLSNATTAEALATLMVAIRDGRAVSQDASDEMTEILLAQRFGEMIPAGLPPGTRVAHKTGSITAIHHDAAIIYPVGAAPYVLVVLTDGERDQEVSGRIGAEVSAAVYRALAGTGQ